MIYLELQGNLGNQLFQYAFARKISIFTGQSICINLYNFNKGRPDLVFSLDDYVLSTDVIIERDKKLPFYADSFSLFSRIVKKICPKFQSILLKKMGVFFWQGEEVRLDFLSDIPPKKDYYIAGWYQSVKYFDDIRDILMKELIPKQNPSKDNLDLYKVICEKESVCISIRRGDYISNPKFNRMYYVCNAEYFQKAIEEINKRVKNPTFIFFSDDIDWVKNNIPAPEGSYYESGKDSTYEKLRLMSGCKHYIVSNSSFSWWAQYLGKKEISVTIAPSRWSANQTKPSEIYQDDWVLIQV